MNDNIKKSFYATKEHWQCIIFIMILAAVMWSQSLSNDKQILNYENSIKIKDEIIMKLYKEREDCYKEREIFLNKRVDYLKGQRDEFFKIVKDDNKILKGENKNLKQEIAERFD